MSDFMASAVIKFLGTDNPEAQECFTAGKSYHADCTSGGNYMVRDDRGDDWHIDGDDDDFEVIHPEEAS